MPMSLPQTSFAAIAGALAFLVADAVEATYWGWFAGNVQVTPWFLNAGRAVLFTGLCVFAVAVAVGATVRRPLEKALLCVCVTGGACAAMAGVLFMRGPGNIFPIVLVIGGGSLFVFAASGTSVSFLVRR